MRKLCGLLAILLAATLPGQLSAQGATVVGRVVDQSQNPLANVQVGVAGTTRGALTNQEGEFTINNVPDGSVEIRASRIGYQQATQRITTVNGQTATVNFTLSQAVVELGAIVVNASGQEQRVRELGNAVATIDVDEVELAPVQSFSQLLNGRAPGVAILPNSGTLGAGSRIRIRGMSSVSLSGTPLLIIDGVRVSNETESSGLFTGGQYTSRIDDLNPEDIESVEILKGPAASALYGTAAANGVIQITTKRGQRGTAQIRAYAQNSSMEHPEGQIPANFRARGLNADGAIIDCDLFNRANGTCLGVDSLYSYNPLEDAPNSPLRTGNVMKYGASVSGGSTNGNITYYVSGEGEEGPGTMVKNHLDRINLRANFSALATESLRLSASTGFIDSYISLPQGDNSGSGPLLNAALGSPDPTNVEQFSGFRGPYGPETVSAWDNEENLRRFTGSLNADWRPLSWLSLNATVGLDDASRYERSFIDPAGLATGFLVGGLREQYRTHDREATATGSANLVHDFSDAINSSTTVGVQYNESLFDWSYAAGVNVTPGTKSAAQPDGIDESGGGDKLIGIYLSEQLSFGDRLFVTAAIRGDQNSAFGENIGFVTYPALSASWVVRDEPWFPQFDFLSNLRLRAAYGESGLRPTRLAAARTFTDEAAAIGGGITPGYIIDNIGNANLKAEISREVEFGADLGFFDDRLGLEVTRYDRTTDDALVRRPLPPSLGGPINQYFNLGSVENSGWEGAIRAAPIRTDNVDLNLRFNFSTNGNKLVSLGDSTIPPITIGLQRHVEGYPLAGYWTPNYTYEDTNGDGLIQRSEVTRQPRLEADDTLFNSSYQGPSIPTRELAFSGDLTLFRDFRFSGLLDHKGGHKLFNWGGRIRCADPTGSFCEDRQVPGASLERQAAIQARPATTSSAGFIEDAAFWKLREVSLTWSVPQSIVGRIGATDALSLTVSGRNLKTWTDYTGNDPESSHNSQTTDVDPGRQFVGDLLGLPAPRTFVVRLDASF